MHGLVQDCSITIANALEILQSFPKPLRYVKISNLDRLYNQLNAAINLFSYHSWII